MKTHVKRTLNAKRFFAVAIIVLIVSISVYLIFRPRVVKTVMIEAGSPMVEVEEFLRNKKTEGSFVS
ncbi:MAG: hypothetical protein GX783_11205, partial [Clostridiales bacterium]|nr:hypothetical protein [Clostridiales bacterium]